MLRQLPTVEQHRRHHRHPVILNQPLCPKDQRPINSVRCLFALFLAVRQFATRCDIMRKEVELKPLKNNKRGYVVMAIYTVRDDNGRAKPKTKWYRTMTEAETFKRKQDRELRQHGTTAAGVSTADRLAAAQWQAFRRNHPDAPDLASIVKTAMAAYAATSGTQTVQEAADAMLEGLRRRGTSSGHCHHQGGRLRRFCATFGTRTVGTITTTEIESYLHAQGFLPANFKAHHQAIHQLFAGLVKRRQLGANPAAGIDLLRVPAAEPGILSPADLRRILAAIPATCVPLAVLQAFCGLRCAEGWRLRWRHIHLDAAEPYIEVPSDVTKTDRRRVIPMQPNAVMWLRQHRGLPEAPVAPRGEETARLTVRVMNNLKLKVRNGLRHSFCTYRLMACRNAAQVAEEAGNSVAIIRRHYTGLADPADAKAWFAIVPDSGTADVVPFSAAV
jgi:integrase